MVGAGVVGGGGAVSWVQVWQQFSATFFFPFLHSLIMSFWAFSANSPHVSCATDFIVKSSLFEHIPSKIHRFGPT